MPELLRLEHFGFTYPQQPCPALADVSLTVRQGEFWVLCGASGCGKTTLLRQLKPALRPHGAAEGRILFDGQPLDDLPPHRQAADIGFVLQSPEEQTVTDKVWHELAFGLESLGCDTPSIRRRVAEMASFFGIQDWFHRKVDELSGGQKQLLALASVMVLQPRLLILDEPTSQLDPIAAADFLQTVGRLNRELGITVLLTEHRLEEALPLATHAAVLDGGVERLSRGISIIVFPQSTRMPVFDEHHFNTIGVKLARKANVPVVPLALKTDAWGQGKKFKELGKITPLPVHYHFGNALRVQGNGKEEHQHICDFIRGNLEHWQKEDGVNLPE